MTKLARTGSDHLTCLFFNVSSSVLTFVYLGVYNTSMKKSDVEKRLRQYGWWFDRHGGNHDIWTNGEFKVALPRHREINELTAKSIIRQAEKYKV